MAVVIAGILNAPKMGRKSKFSDTANECFRGMCMNDTAYRGALFINFPMNGQFVRYLVLFALVWPLAVKVYPLYGINRCIAYAILLRAPAPNLHVF